MIACADIHAVSIHNRSNIVRMYTINSKGQNALMLLCRLPADNMHAFNLLHSVEGQLRQCFLACFDNVEANAVNIVNRCMQANCSGSINRASLELMLLRSIFWSVAAYEADHLAAT